MTGSISAPGLGSGLDVNGIVSQLMAVESQPLNKLDRKEAAYQAQISGFGTLKSALADFQDALDALKRADTFRATSGRSSDTEVVTLTTEEGVVPSTYDVQVTRLAQRHKYGSQSFASTQTFGGNAGDSLTITSGTASFTVDLSTAKTLEEIQAAINVDANDTGITAGVITGNGGDQVLVLTSGKSGYDARVQVHFGGTLDAATFGFTTLNRDAAGNPLASDTELDAALVVDGVSVTRSGNRIDDVIAGVTLELTGTGSATLTVDKDPGVAQKAVSGFVEAYNELKSTLGELYGSALQGHSLVRSVETRLRGVLNRPLEGIGVYGYMAELGVTTNKDTGKLEFDADRLTTALEENPDSVTAFFSDADKGFARRVDELVESFIGTGGVIDDVVRGVNSSIERVNDQRAALLRRLEMVEKRYREQFTALDTLMAQMTTTSDYLGRQLDALAAMVDRDK